METESIITGLERNAEVFPALVRGVDARQARWKPAPDAWAILEVVAHLADEESRDFRRRIDYTLNRPGERWPPIDPPRWAVEEGYLERELKGEVERFRSERRRSVAWLRGLVDPDWSREYEHPSLGTLSAGDLLASWLAHDLLHVRQINRLWRALLVEELAPGRRVDYAGDW